MCGNHTRTQNHKAVPAEKAYFLSHEQVLAGGDRQEKMETKVTVN